MYVYLPVFVGIINRATLLHVLAWTAKVLSNLDYIQFYVCPYMKIYRELCEECLLCPVFVQNSWSHNYVRNKNFFQTQTSCFPENFTSTCLKYSWSSWISHFWLDSLNIRANSWSKQISDCHCPSAAVPNPFEPWTPKCLSARFRGPLPNMFGITRGGRCAR